LEKKTELKNFTFLVFIFLVAQTISIINAVNIFNFLSSYNSYVFCVMLYFLIITTKLNKRKVINIIFATGLINIFLCFFLYFWPDLLMAYLNQLFYDKYFNALEFQMNRGRYFTSMFIEPLFPFLAFYFQQKEIIAKKIIILFYGNFILFLDILSSWRIKILVYVFSVVASALVFIRKNIALTIVLINVFIIIVIAVKISQGTVGINVIQRIFWPSNSDIENVYGRFSYWQEGLDIWQRAPLSGVGLGNDLEHSELLKDRQSLIMPKTNLIDNPHNIFISILVDTGILGLITYLLLLYFFWKKIF